MYQAIVSPIKTAPHPNADKLQIGYCHGFQVVIGLNIEEGQLGVFFPTDGQISDEFCKANDLYPRFDDEGKRIGGGFIDPKNRRIRAQNFRGVKSEGFWVPLSYFDYIPNLELKEGSTFTELKGHEICNKYINPATLRAIKNAQEGKTQKATYRETPLFPMHEDTKQLKYFINSLPLGSTIYISEKNHGTCLKGRTPVTLLDGSKRKIKDLQVGDSILGYQNGNFVESKVLQTHIYPAGQKWFSIKFAGNQGLSATETHEIYIKEKGYTKISEVEVGDTLIVAKLVNSPNLPLESFLAGKFLGDGCARLSKNTKKAALEFGHKKEHFDYLEYCKDIVEPLGVSNLKNWVSGYGTEMLSYRTQSHELLKVISDDPLELFTLESMAILYMDDGSLIHNEKQKDRATFAICSLTPLEARKLSNKFVELGFENTLYFSNKTEKPYPRIRLNKDAAEKFFKSIRHLVPDIVQYKLPEYHRGFYTGYPDTQAPLELREFQFEVKEVKDLGFNERIGRYDITTSTHNFFAREVLVHNSGRTANAPSPQLHISIKERLLKAWKVLVHG